MRNQPHLTPVIVGVGEITQRKVQDLSEALEPLALIEQSARRALEDAESFPADVIDSIRVVGQVSWTYRDLAGAVARRLGLRNAETINGPVGGESPVRLLVDAASDIAAGRATAALVCGAEALRSLGMYHAAGRTPDWSDSDPTARLPIAEDFVTEIAARYGLLLPLDVYPLYENALRKHWKQGFEEAQAESGEIWANMSKVAAQNDSAWGGTPRLAADIVTPSEDNRPVTFPYQKFMVANLGVNQGAAILVTSLAKARELGIAEERLIYIWGGAGAHEPYDFLARDRYDHAPAMSAVLDRTLHRHGLTSSDVQLFELYSCFPCVPKLARRQLDLDASAELSVTGGLTFFGGPGNNYMTHAIAAMVRALRSGRGANGLLYGNGEFVTKHHAAIVSRNAPPENVEVANENLQAQVEQDYGTVPALAETYEGPCTIETFQLRYTPKGTPDRGTVVARTPDGRRVLARVTEAEPDVLAWLASGQDEPVGVSGVAYAAGDGWIHFAHQRPAQIAEHAVLFEMRGPNVALLTINRPKQRNAIDGSVARLLAQYVDRIENDPAIRVAVLTGAGDAAFCAGADLMESRAGRGMDLVVGKKGFAGFVNSERRKPWIAAVKGFALGGGTEIALACDLVVAAESARFGLPEVARSLVAAAGGVYRLPRVVPRRVAFELILTGAQVDAKRALEIHLINRVVPDAELIDAAVALANEIAANSPLAVQESLLVARRSADEAEAALATQSMAAIGRLSGTQDFREGIAAFAEKRAPNWQGR
jgi:acetyl-CoA C-acetyltransferase